MKHNYIHFLDNSIIYNEVLSKSNYIKMIES